MKKTAFRPFFYHVIRLFAIAVLLLTLLAPLSLGVTPVQAAPAAASWYDGGIQYTTITNCFSIIQGSPYLEYGMGAYTGFYADPNNGSPSPNVPYYIHVVLAGLGNNCAGGTRSYVDVGLPPNTSLAISGANPVVCIYDNAPLSPCPQSLPASSLNPGFYNFPGDAAHGNTWAIVQGHIFEVRIPVQTSTALTNSTLQARIWAIDGENNGWLSPTEGVYVFSSTPSILYPSPATINIAATTARSQANLYTHGIGGTGYFDLGPTSAYGLIHESVAIAPGGNSFLAWDDWGPPALQAGTLYHWRFTFHDSNGVDYFGADQTFTTLPDGLSTIGSGSAAGCTEAALDSAAATAKQIDFNCGPLPQTITLTAPLSVSTALVINGGNKVTLNSSGSSNFFDVQAGGHLTLNQLDLTNGHSTSCGGAIHVLSSGLLTLNDARFTNNSSTTYGGALCVDAGGTAAVVSGLFSANHANNGGAIINSGTLTVTSAIFNANTAVFQGGAIENYAAATVNTSSFSQNKSGINGGGIDTTGNLAVNASIFDNNTAGFRGGAMNNYLGTLTIFDTTVTNNHGAAYGGGITNDAGTTSLTRSLVNANTTVNFGGGVRNSGTMTIIDTTITGNTAGTNGGGLENAGTISLINVTLANNKAAGTGGSIYLGATASSSASFKNTILAFGSPNNCDKAINSLGYNLESSNTCGLAAAGDHSNLNPQLSVLGLYGGYTAVMLPFKTSPVIDAGTNTGCPVIDQRGIVRPLDGDGNGSVLCDIGAVEYYAAVDRTKIWIPILRK